ncbi:hypothetical protein [Sulfurimonas sp.]|jgi:hypothetical protein|uniref:hypothetical protein n=1 Tax=Sulfurimonas sp. TaxID=2022749 RepID=UPI0025DE2C03|nr:hypothetical protein [Sulfurimonas sp.]MCK9473350.1 hypothetical protein [Sulfurimonas sp.]
MKLTNAIKKLSKYGEVKQDGNLFWAEIKSYVVQFRANGPIEEGTTARGFRVKSKNDEDDIMTDYFAGVWCDNLTQAIKVATAA